MFFKNTSRFLITNKNNNSVDASQKFLALARSSLFQQKIPSSSPDSAEKALSYLDEAKKLSPTLESVDYLRAVAFARKSDPFSARQAILEELRHHPRNIQAQDLARTLRSKLFSNNCNSDDDGASGFLDLPAEIKKREPEFAMCYNALLDHTMLDAVRLLSLFSSAREVFSSSENKNPGELSLSSSFSSSSSLSSPPPDLIVECGTAGGGSLVMMGCGANFATTLSSSHPARFKLVSFDTFQGMPKPLSSPETETRDKIISNSVAAKDSHWADGTCCSGSEEHVKRLARAFGFGENGDGGDDGGIETVPGLFGDTLPKYFSSSSSRSMGKIKMLHIDCDWYESTKDCLTHLWPKVEVGGRFQIDDYMYWEGCQTAVVEYFNALPTPPKMEIVGVALCGTKVA